MDKERKKQIEKRIKGLERQINKHKQKILNLIGRKDTTQDYWKKEIEQMEKQASELKAMLREK